MAPEVIDGLLSSSSSSPFQTPLYLWIRTHIFFSSCRSCCRPTPSSSSSWTFIYEQNSSFSSSYIHEQNSSFSSSSSPSTFERWSEFHWLPNLYQSNLFAYVFFLMNMYTITIRIFLQKLAWYTYHRTGKQSETQKEKKTYYHRRTYQNSNVQSKSFPFCSGHFRAFFHPFFVLLY